MGKTVHDDVINDLKPVIPEDDDVLGDDIPAGFSKEEWADLSDEEREGITAASDDDNDDDPGQGDADPDKEEVDIAILEKIAGDQGGDDGNAGGDADPAAKPDLGAFDVSAELEDAPRLPTIPLEVSQEVPTDLKTKIDDLAEKFEAGELSVREYTDQRDALNREVWHRNLADAQDAQAKKTWEAEQRHFLAQNPAYMEDSLRGRALIGMLDAAVRELAQDPAHGNKSGYQLLQLAHKEVAGIIGSGKPDTKEGKAPDTVVSDKGEKPKAVKPSITTLGEVPASSVNATDDPYAAIDRLEGEAYEEALSRMSDAQARAYRARA